MKKWIIGLMAMCAVFFFLRSYWHELSGDELLYQYVWEKDDPTNLWENGHRFERHISSVADIWQTQRIHYMKWSGRSIVHTLEQCFSGPAGFVVFCVINTAVLVLLVWLVVKYVSNESGPYLLWLLTLIGLLYMFPFEDSIWTSINYGLNYLWPGVWSVAVLLLWERIEKGNLPVRWNFGIAMLGLLAGWSNEAFSVGLAGGTFIFYWLNFRRLPRRILWLVIPLWIGTAILVFAPGNLVRFMRSDDGESLSLYYKMLNGVLNLLAQKLFWLALAIVIVEFIYHRSRILSFARASQLLLWMLAVTFLFILVMNSMSKTNTFEELLCMLLILGYMRYCGFFDRETMPKRVSCVALTVLLAAHQAILCVDTYKVSRFQRRMIDEYIASPDGFVRYDAPELFPCSGKFIR